MERITLAEFHERLKSQGVSHEHFAFKCAICGTIQSAQSLIAGGAGKTFDEVEKYLGFSCIGRFNNAPEWKRGTPPGRGCNWTLGGFLRLHKFEVVTPDGEKHPRFEPATPDEAKALMASLDATSRSSSAAVAEARVDRPQHVEQQV